MNLDFNAIRWEKIRRDYSAWWAGELRRPLLHLTMSGRDPGRPEPKLDLRYFHSHYELDIPAAAIADRWLYDLECQHFLGDSFPSVWPNFGPGVMAAFMGLELQNGDDTVWFHQPKDLELADIKLEHLPNNIWLHRVRDLYRAGAEKFEGLVHMGMTDLGGNLDIAASFRQSENLLMDLIDEPEEVEKIAWRSHELWWRYFDELNGLIQPSNPGYTAWTPVYSVESSYMLQCDFCYMISLEMFNRFVKPELAASCRKLVNPIYHLDGPGQLTHLDSILEIPELKAVQWVPGAGQRPVSEWPEVYRKIRAAGKNIQFFTLQDPLGWRCFEKIADQLGSAEGLIMIGEIPSEDEAEVRNLLNKYGA